MSRFPHFFRGNRGKYANNSDFQAGEKIISLIPIEFGTVGKEIKS